MSDKPKKLSNFQGFENLKDAEYYANAVESDLDRLFTYLDRFPRFFEQSAQPTIQRNTFAFWRDTDDGKMYLIADISGNAKKVELT